MPIPSGIMIRRNEPLSLTDQLTEQLLNAIRDGSLREGDPLPPSRALAKHLQVSRGVVVRAYDNLAAGGYIDSRVGASTTVAIGTPDLIPTAPIASPGPLPPSPTASIPTWDCRPGHPDATLIDTRSWRAAWRIAARRTPGVDPAAQTRHVALEQALSTHLRRTRGIAVNPQQIIPVPNTTAALLVLCQAAGLAGKTAAIEEPGYRSARLALERAGMAVRPATTDGEGLTPDALHPTDALVYTTPGHQYPLGGHMSARRRVELVNRAQPQGAVIVEDDYDGEFRYDVSPAPALRSLSDTVAYVGTSSKILTPDLSVAWLVPPAGMEDAARESVAELALGCSPQAAEALAYLIDTGAVSRHLARSKRIYRDRRNALIDALAIETPMVDVVGISAGLHLCAMLPAGTPETQVQRALANRGFRVDTLGQMRVVTPEDQGGLVIGYGQLPSTGSRALAHTLASALAAH